MEVGKPSVMIEAIRNIIARCLGSRKEKIASTVSLWYEVWFDVLVLP